MSSHASHVQSRGLPSNATAKLLGEWWARGIVEQGIFNPRREGRVGLTPLELQLQWRVSWHKRHLGSEALAARRARGIAARTTWILAPSPLSPGDPVTLHGEPIGHVLVRGWSVVREAEVGIALLAPEHAHPGIRAFRSGDTLIVTVSPPLLHNRSLFIDVQRHAWHTREGDAFPPIVAGH